MTNSSKVQDFGFISVYTEDAEPARHQVVIEKRGERFSYRCTTCGQASHLAFGSYGTAQYIAKEHVK